MNGSLVACTQKAGPTRDTKTPEARPVGFANDGQDRKRTTMVQMAQETSRATLAFQVAGDSADRFQVIRYSGLEGLSRLYRFEIEVAARDHAVAFDKIVGKAAVFSIAHPNGDKWFHGIVSRFELTGESAELTYFRIELVPAVWLLCHRYGSRIFQNKTAPEIIEEVLTRAGIATDRYRPMLERSYDKREFCVQYRETDYNFIARLMEEEGIWWYFEQRPDRHVLVFADSKSAYVSSKEDAPIPYVPPTGMSPRDEHVSRFRLGRSVRPGSVTINDFSFENPKLDLKSQADCGRDTGLEVSDYPGEYALQSQGRTLVQIRAEELECGRVLGVGQSNSVRLVPARTFKIERPSEHIRE
ncbi:MAG: type VI secretion system tip protein VgrG [Planctomycetes bacterium]|nr:type VI secretion system tip protein VgrG [Planctomycetota bacterium]